MSALNKALKTTEEVALQIILLCQVGIAAVANILLLVHNLSPNFAGPQLRPKHVILAHIAVGNLLIILLTGFPSNMTVFVPRNPLNDLNCKLEYFIRLVARSANMCTTCVLSTYQFIVLVPGKWSRVILRGNTSTFVHYSCNSCWIISVLNNVYIPIKISGPWNTDNNTDPNSKWVCSNSGFELVMVFLRFVHDAIFISIMVWTSVSMMLLLYRHHQSLKHIHRSNGSLGLQPEARAAYTILMLVITFVCFYLLDCICIFFHISFVHFRVWLRHVSEILAASFPTISPLMLIFRGPKKISAKGINTENAFINSH